MEAQAGIAAGSPRVRPKAIPRKDAQKSRVANGSALFAGGIDGRSVWVRRARELINDHVSDLGGIENTSAAERSIIRRASALTVECERFEARFAQLDETAIADRDDLDLYRKCADSLRRLLETVGLKRVPRDIGGVVYPHELSPLRRQLQEAIDAAKR